MNGSAAPHPEEHERFFCLGGAWGTPSDLGPHRATKCNADEWKNSCAPDKLAGDKRQRSGTLTD